MLSSRGHDGVVGGRGYSSERGETSLSDGKGMENREEKVWWNKHI